MSKLLVVLALVVGFSMFTLLGAGEASAMNKGELIDAISNGPATPDGADLSKADAKRALDGFVTATSDALKKGDRISLVGFGSFLISKRAARKLAEQDDLPPNDAGCLWLSSRAPHWIHGLFCTTSESELVDLMTAKPADGTPGLSRETAQLFLERFKSVTTAQLVLRDFVEVEDFGTFSVKEGKGRRLNTVEFDVSPEFAARVGRNPQTGKEIKIAANNKNVVKFKAGADLSKKVN